MPRVGLGSLKSSLEFGMGRSPKLESWRIGHYVEVSMSERRSLPETSQETGTIEPESPSSSSFDAVPDWVRHPLRWKVGNPRRSIGQRITRPMCADVRLHIFETVRHDVDSAMSHALKR